MEDEGYARRITPRWKKGGIRYNATKNVEDSRMQTDSNGIKRVKVDECSETDYCSRRREPKGFYRGAKIGKRIV